tara:strand:+ start:5204 stop:5500 length:297 start_codon:yes stop_codon:yes gene_type:complete
MSKDISDNNVCRDQNTFNDAVHDAINNYRDSYSWDSLSQSQKTMAILFLVFYLIFTIWAVILALRVPKENGARTFHVIVALLFGPLYFIAYYISNWNM